MRHSRLAGRTLERFSATSETTLLATAASESGAAAPAPGQQCKLRLGNCLYYQSGLFAPFNTERSRVTTDTCTVYYHWPETS